MKKIKTIKNSRGFTLIELMITVAIVGILTAVALPAYQDYAVRSQVSEGLSLVSGAKPVVGEYFSNHGEFPTNEEAGFTGYVGKFITKTEIGTDGKIIATFGNQANSKIATHTLTLIPEASTDTGNIKWSCESSANAKYLPTSCANNSSTGNPGNPGGGTDPVDPVDPGEGGGTTPENPGGTDPGEGGPTTPTQPPFDPAFTAKYSNGVFSYENGALTFYDSNGPVALEVLESGDDGITYAGNEFYSTINIDRDGNLVLESARTYPNGVEYNMKSYSVKSPNGTGGITYEQAFTNSTGTYNISSLGYSEMPPYVISNFQPYNNFLSSYAQMSSSITNNQAPTQAQIDNYNTSKATYINFLNEQKTNGATLSAIDELFLKQNN